MHNTVQHLLSQSVCLSVMTQYSVKMAQPIIKILSATDSPNILVFCDWLAFQNSDGFTRKRGLKDKWSIEIWDIGLHLLRCDK